jgi:flagellar biosynthesis GTPase FlhF
MSMHNRAPVVNTRNCEASKATRNRQNKANKSTKQSKQKNQTNSKQSNQKATKKQATATRQSKQKATKQSVSKQAKRNQTNESSRAKQTKPKENANKANKTQANEANKKQTNKNKKANVLLQWDFKSWRKATSNIFFWKKVSSLNMLTCSNGNSTETERIHTLRQRTLKTWAEFRAFCLRISSSRTECCYQWHEFFSIVSLSLPRLDIGWDWTFPGLEFPTLFQTHTCAQCSVVFSGS